MPWWAWLIIWASLCLILLGTLALFAISLFFKIKAIAIELEHLASQTARLEQAERVLDDQRQELAVLAGYAKVRRRRERLRFEASLRTQARRRANIQRAKELIRVDAAQKDWFPAHDQTSHRKPR